MKKIIYLLIFLLTISIVASQEVQVVKESLNEIKLNDVIEVKIHISNPSSAEKEFNIIENLPQNIEVIDPVKVFTKKNDALEVKYYEWITKISPNSIKTITYKIKPLSLGEYSIGPTRVVDNSNLATYENAFQTTNARAVKTALHARKTAQQAF